MNPQPNPEIFIITGPVGIGKSTLLSQFFRGNSIQAAGFLNTIDPKSKFRTLRLLPDQETIPFEVENASDNAFSADNRTEATLSVGKFHFVRRAFDQGIDALKRGTPTCDIAVIDELGKLEIEQHTGFEPHFTQWLRESSTKQMVVIIRSSLLKKAKSKYNWERARVNEGPWMPAVPNIMGLVLAGGQSSRMGKDKKIINYHGKPQWKQAYNCLSELKIETVVSATGITEEGVRIISDAPKFEGNGPISGLLSVSEEIQETALLVLGVDYPEMDRQTLYDLLLSFQVRNCSVCYRNPQSNRVEPLIAIYHPRDLHQIKEGFYKGNTSLSRFWEQEGNAVLVLPHKNYNVLKSYDLPEDEAAFRTR